MTEAILAGEQVKELPLINLLAVLAPVLAELARLSKNLLMRNCPGDAGDGESKQQEKGELMRKRLIEKARLHVYITPDRHSLKRIEVNSSLSISASP
jgi:hypothetical protein